MRDRLFAASIIGVMAFLLGMVAVVFYRIIGDAIVPLIVFASLVAAIVFIIDTVLSWAQK